MTATRTYPLPSASNTLHALSDLHCHPGFVYEVRRPFVLNDMARPTVPQCAYHLNLGDFANTAAADQYVAGKAFMDALGGTWYSVVGNHDMWTPGDSTGLQPQRAAALAAADMGMPTSSYTADLGYAVLIVPHPTDRSLTYDVSWLDAALTANAGRTCIIAAHGSLKDTAGTNADTSLEWRTSDVGWHASGVAFDVVTDLDACLAAHDNAKVWIGGHTHSSLNATRVVSAVTKGSHTMAAINAMSIAYTGKTAEWFDTIASLFITVSDTQIDVRFRDHGAGAWAGGSSEYKRVWSVAL